MSRRDSALSHRLCLNTWDSTPRGQSGYLGPWGERGLKRLRGFTLAMRASLDPQLLAEHGYLGAGTVQLGSPRRRRESGVSSPAPFGQDSGPANLYDVGDTRAHVFGPRRWQSNLGKVLAHESPVNYKDRAVEPFLQPAGILSRS